MSDKKKLGQFYTTNYKHILKNTAIPQHISKIIEPFCGKCDLIKFIDNAPNYEIELYDIDPNNVSENNSSIVQDTLKNPPNYEGSFVLTNPPYLARNKSADKSVFNLYGLNDLYKCFIKSIINNNPLGGIMIIPLNFISSIRKADVELRRDFLKHFKINIINIFEKPVFSDTTYSVCSIMFEKISDTTTTSNAITSYIYPGGTTIEITFNAANNYTIGGEIYKLPLSKDIKIERATRTTKKNMHITNMLLKCIDDSATSKICLKIVSDSDKFIDETPKLSARSYASIAINKKITMETQQLVVAEFDRYLNEQRTLYNSLFLTNYRNNNRKRISFELAFNIINYICNTFENHNDS